jgi:predicted nucleotidyltransferase
MAKPQEWTHVQDESRRAGMKADRDLENLKRCVKELRDKGKILIAVLFGSQANGEAHVRSDIDLGVFLSAKNQNEEVELIDRILMCSEIPISILRLDDDEESPLVVQEALKGVHLVDPEREALYGVFHRVLHEGEAIRARRELRLG